MRAPCVARATQGLRARGGSESLYGSAWFGFGSVSGGILGGIARVGFSHRESTSPDPQRIAECSAVHWRLVFSIPEARRLQGVQGE